MVESSGENLTWIKWRNGKCLQIGEESLVLAFLEGKMKAERQISGHHLEALCNS